MSGIRIQSERDVNGTSQELRLGSDALERGLTIRVTPWEFLWLCVQTGTTLDAADWDAALSEGILTDKRDQVHTPDED